MKLICPVCQSEFNARPARIYKTDNPCCCSVKCACKIKKATNPVDYFWNRVKKSKTCWIWAGSKNNYGYGMLRCRDASHQLAHRFSWELVHGKISDGKVICHKCDIPSCVKPDHLFLGTRDDNNKDSVAKGRNAYGSKLPQTKLVEYEVRQILRLFTSGSITNRRQLARMYGVTDSTITKILKRRTWKRVHNP